MNRILKATLLIFGLLPAAASLALADFSLDWWTVDGGGDMWTTGGGFELSGTIGQPDAGTVMTGGGFELTGGFWAVGAPEVPQVCVGDLNCDGSIDFGDINPFVLYLSNFSAWQAEFPGCTALNGDIDCDGTYGQASFVDINPFVALMGQCGVGCACPGPVSCP